MTKPFEAKIQEMCAHPGSHELAGFIVSILNGYRKNSITQIEDVQTLAAVILAIRADERRGCAMHPQRLVGTSFLGKVQEKR